MKTFSVILGLLLFNLLFSKYDAAAVGKGAVGSGGRGRGGKSIHLRKYFSFNSIIEIEDELNFPFHFIF